MTSSNLELVRSILAAWEGGDFGSAEWPHPDIEYAVIGGPAPATVTGKPAMARVVRDLLSAWEDYRVKVEECVAPDDERVLALIRSVGRGKASGLALPDADARGAYLFHVRGGRVTRLCQYFDWDGVLSELGLSLRSIVK